MLSNTSWTAFSTCIIALLVVYYLTIAIIFFRRELSLLVSGQNRTKYSATDTGLTAFNRSYPDIMGPAVEEPVVVADHSRYQPAAADAAAGSPQVNNSLLRPRFADACSGIKILVAEIAKKENQADELKIMLPPFLEQYEQLSQTAYRSKVNDYILEQCHSHFSIGITEDEINDLW